MPCPAVLIYALHPKESCMFRRLTVFCLAVTAVLATTSMPVAQQPASPAPAAPPQAGPRGGGRGAPPVKSPEVAGDGRVTFRLRAPNAKEVAVTLAGNRVAMQKDEQGVWSASSDVLTPDYYTYPRAVNGRRVHNP